MTENILFKKLLLDSNYFSNVFSNLKKDDFNKIEHKDLFKCIGDLYSKYNKAPNLNEISLYFDSANMTQKDRIRINEALDEIKRTDIDIKEDMLVDFTEKWVKNVRTNQLLFLGADYLDGKTNETPESIQAKMEEINKLTFKKSAGLDYKKDALKNFEEYTNINENGIKSSLEIVNIATNGGLLPGTLTLFSSISNGGKTIFLVNSGCDALLSGNDVAYFTFEETELEIRERFDARLMDMNTSEFAKRGKALVSNFNTLLNKGLGNLKIKDYGPRSASVLTVKAQLEEWELKEGFKPKIVILDSITIIAPSTKSDSMYMNGKNVSEEAKALGVHLGIPIVSAVQIGRSGYGSSSVGIEDISESLATAQVASTMIGIISDEQRPDIRTLSIIKSRKVNKSKVKAQNVHIDTDKQKVWDMADNERRVYLKAEQKEELNTMNKIVEASEVVKDEKDIIKAENKPGGSLLDSLLAK